MPKQTNPDKEMAVLHSDGSVGVSEFQASPISKDARVDLDHKKTLDRLNEFKEEVNFLIQEIDQALETEGADKFSQQFMFIYDRLNNLENNAFTTIRDMKTIYEKKIEILEKENRMLRNITKSSLSCFKKL